MNQLSMEETARNRKLLKDLVKNMRQVISTVNQLEYQAKQLYASVNFINFMLAVRHKLATIRDSTFVIQQDLSHLYKYLITLSVKKLIPEMITPYDLQALLDVVIEDLESHPKLPVKPTEDTVYKYYQIITASVIMFDEMLLCALHIPLVDRSKIFHIFKIHNLHYLCQF